MHDKRVFLSINIPPMSLDLVIIPTYNEIENVEAIIRAVVDLGQGYHILIVDDNFRPSLMEICTSKFEKKNQDWERPTFTDSNGRFKTTTILFLKWMLIFRIHQLI